MKIQFLSQLKAKDKLIELTQTCESMDWAVAWATPNEVLEEALQHRQKLRRLVIGTHLYQTHPDVLQRFLNDQKVRVMPPTGDLFHPKVYLFTTGDTVKAVVGSHNLTHSAMWRNIEASMLIEGLATDQALSDVRGFIQSAWLGARQIDSAFMTRYGEQYKAKTQARESLTAFVEFPLPKITGTERTPHGMGWSDFVKQVLAKREPSVHDFLAALDGVGQIFERRGSFVSMSLDEQKLIAGTAGPKKSLRGNIDFQLFGSMGGNGSFASVVINASDELSLALDEIPALGPVSESDFKRFIQRFAKAFVKTNAEHQGGLPTATRLLAMKRPDVFVCINAANKQDLCAHFGVAPSTTGIENYWKRIISPMMQTDWWQSSKPTDPLEEKIWNGRAALLDVIYYDRSAHNIKA